MIKNVAEARNHGIIRVRVIRALVNSDYNFIDEQVPTSFFIQKKKKNIHLLSK